MLHELVLLLHVEGLDKPCLLPQDRLLKLLHAKLEMVPHAIGNQLHEHVHRVKAFNCW